jgi:hypothetical protein
LSQSLIKAEDGLFDEARERRGLIHFYNKLEELAEAAYLIDQQERKRYPRSKSKIILLPYRNDRTETVFLM